MRNTFAQCLLERARKDRRIFVITADMGFSVFEGFAERFPDRFLNVGVAEQNAVGVAAGLALSGRVVYVYSIIPFITMRCFEQIRLDAAYMHTNIRLVGVGAGLSYGAQGPTHHAVEDIAIMRSLPGMTVCCPGDPVETRQLLEQSFDYKGPIYFRLGKNRAAVIHDRKTKITIGKAIKLKDGKDGALIVTSTMLEQGMQWVEAWARKGIRVTLLSMPTLKPLDKAAVSSVIRRGLPIITLEEHGIIGGLGSAVAEVIAESGKSVKFRRIALPDEYSRDIGGQEYLRKKSGLGRMPSF
jgi:transketolase